MTPLVITAERERVIEFSKPYITTGISIMTFKPKRSLPEVFSFLTPLSTSTWLCVIAAYFCVSTVIYIVARFSPGAYSFNNINKSSSGNSNISKHENHNNLHHNQNNSIHTSSSYATTTAAATTSSSSSSYHVKGHLSISNALWYSFCVLTHRHQAGSVIKR